MMMERRVDVLQMAWGRCQTLATLTPTVSSPLLVASYGILGRLQPAGNNAKKSFQRLVSLMSKA